MRKTQKTVDTQTPIKQIQAIFASTPASALYLLNEQTKEPLSIRVKEFLEHIASDYLEELTPLTEQLNYIDLANWLKINETYFEDELTKTLKQKLANGYTATNVSRNGMPVIRYSRTIIEISPDLIYSAIEQHIEATMLIHYGSSTGRKETIRFLTAMTTQNADHINPFGVLVLDELFSEIIAGFEKNGIPVFSAEH